MSFNIIVPNGAQSPGIFPAQNNANFSRLQTLIAGDHQFNNSVAANDGCHKQATYINKPTDQLPVTALPTGTNLMSFTKNASDNVPDLWLFDGTNPQYQYSWRELTGTIALNQTTFTDIVVIPNNSFGQVFLFITVATIPYCQLIYFAANAATLNAYSVNSTQIFTVVANPVNVLGPTNGLTLSGQTRFGLGGTWTYKVEYRKVT